MLRGWRCRKKSGKGRRLHEGAGFMGMRQVEDVAMIEGCLSSTIRSIGLETTVQFSGAQGLPNELLTAVEEMRNLETMDLFEVEIRTLPSVIGHFENLRVLDLTRAQFLESIDNEDVFRRLKKLKVLSLSETGIRNLPAAVGHLTNLEFLNCKSARNLRYFHFKALKGLKKLRVLRLDFVRIPRLPPAFGLLESLETLWCSAADIDEIVQLKILRRLFLRDTGMRSLPAAIGQLKRLEELEVWGEAMLESIEMEVLEDLKHLKILKFCRTGICSFPGRMGHWDNLVELECSESESSTIPAWIAKLRRLTVLDLNNNLRLTELPSSIVEMNSLQGLALSGCRNLKFPPLEHLGDLRNTAVVARRAKEYFRKIRAAPATLDYQVSSRVVFLGHSFSGKSQLVDMLLQNRFHPTAPEDRADCAVVHHTTTSTDQEESAELPWDEPPQISKKHRVSDDRPFLNTLHERRASLWDLAGQREFAFLRNRFLTNRAVYVLVVAAEREPQQGSAGAPERVAGLDEETRVRQVESWVQRIRHISRDAPLPVVLNKFGRENGDVDTLDGCEMVDLMTKRLQESGCDTNVDKFLVINFYGEVPMDALSTEQTRQIRQLSDWIRSKLESFSNPVMPKVMEIVEMATRELAATGRPCIPFEKWRDRCDEAMREHLPGGRRLGRTELKSLLQILNESGVVMWDDGPTVGRGGDAATCGIMDRKSVLLIPNQVVGKLCLLNDSGRYASATLRRWIDSARGGSEALIEDFTRRGAIKLWKSDLCPTMEKKRGRGQHVQPRSWSVGMRLCQRLLLSSGQLECMSDEESARYVSELFDLAVDLRLAYCRDVRVKVSPLNNTEVDGVEYVFPGRLCEIDSGVALERSWEGTWDDRGKQPLRESDRVYGWQMSFGSTPIECLVPAMCSLYNKSRMDQRILWITELPQPQDHLERAMLRAEERREGRDYMLRVDVRYENAVREGGRLRPHVVEVVVRVSYDQDQEPWRRSKSSSRTDGEPRMWEVFTRVLENVLEEIDTHASRSMKENMGDILHRYADSQGRSSWTVLPDGLWGSRWSKEDVVDLRGMERRIPVSHLRPPSTDGLGERVRMATKMARSQQPASDGDHEMVRRVGEILEEKIAPAMCSLVEHARNREDEELLLKSTCPYMFFLENNFPEDGIPAAALPPRILDRNRMFLVDQRTMRVVQNHEGYPLTSLRTTELQSRLVHGLVKFRRGYEKMLHGTVGGVAQTVATFEPTTTAVVGGAEATKAGLAVLVECLEGLELNANLKKEAMRRITATDGRFRIDLALDPSLLASVEEKLRAYDMSVGRPAFDVVMHPELFDLGDGTKVAVWVANNAQDSATLERKAAHQEAQMLRSAVLTCPDVRLEKKPPMDRRSLLRSKLASCFDRNGERRRGLRRNNIT